MSLNGRRRVKVGVVSGKMAGCDTWVGAEVHGAIVGAACDWHQNVASSVQRSRLKEPRQAECSR